MQMGWICSDLKMLGVRSEIGPEFAKEKVWEESFKILEDQIYVFAKQRHTLIRVAGKVDVVVTDSPLLLSLIYGEGETREFHDLVLREDARFNQMHFFLDRHDGVYEQEGRIQDLEGARAIDRKILGVLDDNRITYERLPPGGRGTADYIVNRVLARLGRTR
jgi:hypothetical protein